MRHRHALTRGAPVRRALSLAALAFALCASPVTSLQAMAADTPTSVPIAKPAEGTHFLLVKPEITLALLTASGMHEPKVEWSKSAQDNLSAALTKAIVTRKQVVDTVAVDIYDTPRAIQIIKLNEVVTASIYLNRLPAYKLPTKTGFDWTLGEGAATLLPAVTEGTPAPKYALFINGEGTFSSGGRAAMMVGMALLGASMPMGGQSLRASLVDLQTGQIVWAEFQTVAAGTDIRTPEGADAAVEKLLKALPF
jgi:hypothetical protein